jgi:hypothetical protein
LKVTAIFQCFKSPANIFYMIVIAVLVKPTACYVLHGHIKSNPVAMNGLCVGGPA